MLLQVAVHMSDDIALDQVIEILRRESRGDHFDRATIQSRLDDLMSAAGLFVNRAGMSEEEVEYGLAFLEPEPESDRGPGPREKARHYAKILESPDPLGEGLIHSIYRAEINALARSRKPRGINISRARPYATDLRRASLTERLSHDLALFREVAEALKSHNERLVQPGAPIMQPRNTLLIMLAELYVELTNKDIDAFDLPHSENSRFIRFCHWALEPHLPEREIGTAALSKAWKRLKDTERGGTQ